MRLSLSLLVAALFHGVLLGVGAAALARWPSAPAVLPAMEIDVEPVEIIQAKPDPIADAMPGNEAGRQSATPARPPLSPSRRPPRIAHETPVAANEVAPSLAASADGTFPAVPVGVPAAQPSSSSPPSGSPASARSGVAVASSGAEIVATAKPRYRTNPKPDYPIASQRRREEGVVVLNVAVDASGTPTSISLQRSSGHPLLDRAALDAVRRWTFEPARLGGVPMVSRVDVPVRFSLDDLP
jgi:periplasmic protein TonB